MKSHNLCIEAGINHQSPILAFLNHLDTRSIPYVVWKNNHELSSAIAGESDLNIFVPVCYKEKFLRLAFENSWIILENPVARFPGITHYYKLDHDLKAYHLHVYSKIVTGESWLKEYILPFDDFLLEKRVRSEEFGIWILERKTQAYLFVVRHILKGGSFFSRTLYKWEIESYRNEWDLCHQDLETLSDWGPIRLEKYIDKTGLQKNPIKPPNIIAVLKFRASLFPFMRVYWMSLPFRRIKSFIMRALNNVVFRRKKIFPVQGTVIAISGADGAGKSTMLNEAHSVLSQFMTVRRFALGKPQSRLLEAVRKLLKRVDEKGAPQEIMLAKQNHIKKPTIMSSLSATVLAFLRLRMARKAMKSALKGYLVLVDRWPTDKLCMMDGPKLYYSKSDSFFFRVLARIENWAYLHMPRANLCFFLETSLQTLIKRNKARLKLNKETKEDINRRYQQNLKFAPLARKVIRFDNEGNFNEKRKELILQIWQELVHTQVE